MFKFIFDLATEPLGLPIEWYYEWIILGVIEAASYKIAYHKVGCLYRGGFISGKVVGSFFHWIIKTVYFVIIWAITYGMIHIRKFVVLHKIEVGIGLSVITAVAIIVKLMIWYFERYKLKKVKEVNKQDE